MTSLRPSAMQGFSLVETLIALAIVAVMTALLFGGLSQNAHAARLMADRRLSIMVAQSVLEQGIVEGGFSRSGVSGDLAWQLTVEPYRDAGPGDDLQMVMVVVTRPPSIRPLATLRTVRIVH